MNSTRTSVGIFAGAVSFAPIGTVRALETCPEFREAIRGVEAGLDGMDISPLLDLALGAGGSADVCDHRDAAVPPLVQLATATGLYAVRQREGIRPDVLLGHSLGEIAALVAGGAFLPADGARIIRMRMRAAEQVQDRGGMIALDTDGPRASHLVETIASPSLRVACHNAPRATVVSGTLDDLAMVKRLAETLGLRAARLPVRFPYHSPVMAPLVETLRHELAASGVRQRTLHTPVHCVFDNRRHTDQDDLLGHIAEMYVRPVLFLESVRSLHGGGVDRYLDYGADGTITRMVEAALPAVEVSSALPDPVSMARSKLAVPASAAEQPPVEPTVAERSPHPSALIPPVPHPVSIPGPGSSRTDLLAELAEMYADIVGYPVDVFTEDVDLEGELGIDSLRQVAMLVKVTERFGLPRTEFRLNDYPTLGSIADSVVAQLKERSR